MMVDAFFNSSVLGEIGCGPWRGSRRRGPTPSDAGPDGRSGQSVRRRPGDLVDVGTTGRGPGETPAGGQRIRYGLQRRTPEPCGVRRWVPRKMSRHAHGVCADHVARRVTDHSAPGTVLRVVRSDIPLPKKFCFFFMIVCLFTLMNAPIS